MNVIPFMVFVSLLLVVASLFLFVHSMRKKDHQHSDRLALLPLTQEERVTPAVTPAVPPTKAP